MMSILWKDISVTVKEWEEFRRYMKLPTEGTYSPLQYISALYYAMAEFCDRVEVGEVQSKRTYKKFKDLLGRG